MENLVLNAVSRDTTLKARDLRQQDRVPAVVYGDKKDNIFIDFDYQEFRKLYKKAGHNTLINLVVDGKKDSSEVLVHMVSYEPVSGNFSHVDLRRITSGVEITTEVNITFEGVSEAVKTLGGVLVTNKAYLDIKCLPKNLIHEVTADLSKLVDFHSKIVVADIEVPKTVTVLNDPEEVVAIVSAPRSVIEEEPVATATEGAETSPEASAGEKKNENA